jgi:hypothetical protein
MSSLPLCTLVLLLQQLSKFNCNDFSQQQLVAVWCLGTGEALTLPLTAVKQIVPDLHTNSSLQALAYIYQITLCTKFCSFPQQLFFKWRSSSGFLQHVMIKCSNFLENCTASIFKVTEFVQVDVKWCDERRGTYIRWLQGSWPITAIKDKKMAKDCLQPMRFQYLFEAIQSTWKWRL